MVTEGTAKPHCDDVVCETQTGEFGFGVVYRGVYEGKFRGDVAVKRMKEAGEIAESMAQSVKEVWVLDKFWGCQIVHFFGVVLPGERHGGDRVWALRLADGRDREEAEFRFVMKLMLDAAKGLAYLHSNWFCTGTSRRTTSSFSRWTI